MAGGDARYMQPACLQVIQRDRTHDRANCIQSIATFDIAATWSNSGAAADLPVTAGAAFERLA